MQAKLSLFLIVVGMWIISPSFAGADGSCNTPGNLTYNCNFDNFVNQSSEGAVRIVPEGWAFWVTMGSPAFDIDDHGSAPGAPAQRIWSDGGSWTAGLYQQVQVTQGKGYVAKIDWAAPNITDIERKIGIDPLGGTDPLAPRIVWSSSAWDKERMPDLHISAFAKAPTITVFVWTHHPVSHGADQVFLDAVTLVEDPTLVPPPTLTPTLTPKPTRRPPTRTPSPVPPTDTPTAPPPTSTAVDTSTPLPPTETLTPLPTPTWTATPTSPPPTETSTPTPTLTPTATPVKVAAAAQPRTPVVVARPARTGNSSTQPESIFLYISIAALIGAFLLASVVLVLRLFGQKTGEQG